MAPSTELPRGPAIGSLLLLLLLAMVVAARLFANVTSVAATSGLSRLSDVPPTAADLPPAPGGAVGGADVPVRQPAGSPPLALLPAPPSPLPVPRAAAIPSSIGGRVVAEGTGLPVSQAFVSAGEETVQTDADGWFTLSAIPDTPTVHVVAAGYHVLRDHSLRDGDVLALTTFVARAIYLPYEQQWDPNSLAWAVQLARDGKINALVVDIKEEGGGVLPLVATDAVRSLGAVVDPGTDVERFLDELQELGVYRIARVVTFLDRRFVLAFPDDAIRTAHGGVLDDGTYAWADPSSPWAQAYNLAIGERAAAVFDEVQFDYVRFPGNSALALRDEKSGSERSAAITEFAATASARLHRHGAALSFATFGVTTVIQEDGGIGQVLEDLAPYLDYYAPMLYPSTWPLGSLGWAYPAAHPGAVVSHTTAMAVDRAEAWSTMRIRPWLQDFTDYGTEGLRYGPSEVFAQIRGAREAGASGFMLWDPSLNYALSGG